MIMGPIVYFIEKKISSFREEWTKLFPWVTKDQSGNPGLAFCTPCSRSLPALKYKLRKHERNAKHTRRAANR